MLLDCSASSTIDRDAQTKAKVSLFRIYLSFSRSTSRLYHIACPNAHAQSIILSPWIVVLLAEEGKRDVVVGVTPDSDASPSTLLPSRLPMVVHFSLASITFAFAPLLSTITRRRPVVTALQWICRRRHTGTPNLTINLTRINMAQSSPFPSNHLRTRFTQQYTLECIATSTTSMTLRL